MADDNEQVGREDSHERRYELKRQAEQSQAAWNQQDPWSTPTMSSTDGLVRRSDAYLEQPALMNMVSSASKALAKFAATGFRRVTPDMHQARIDQCESCRHRQATSCTLCGCYFSKKAWLPLEDCPIGKWPT